MEMVFSSLFWEAGGLLCAECIPVHSSVLQDIAEAPRGHPCGAEWLGHEIPKMLGGVQVGSQC